MLTGEPPFTGATAQAIVARVLTEAPRPLHAQRHTIPPHVEAAVLTRAREAAGRPVRQRRRVRRGAPEQGLHATTAVVPAVAARAGAGAAGAAGERGTMAARRLAAGRSRRAALWGWLRPGRAEPLTQFSLALRGSEALQPPPTGGGGRIAVSPDGRQIVFTGPGQGSSQLWLRRLDQLTSTPIAGTEGGY